MDTNNSKTLNIFESIKSKYILKRIFKYLSETKLLKIIKYNKILQNKLEINIDDYKNISKIIIELEMLPDHDGIHTKAYKKIKFVKFSRKDIVDMSSLFHFCIFLQEIDFSYFNTENVINMESMFF